MVSLTTPHEALQNIAARMRLLRISHQLRQQDLAIRSGVPIASVRKFERTGIISLESFLKLALILEVLDNVVAAVMPSHELPSIDEMIAESKVKSRKRVR